MRELFLLDGGFSSQINNYIGDETLDKINPLWCSSFLVSNREAVVKTHRDYVKAGCDVVTTNTYQASVPGFQKYLGLSEQQSLQLMKDSVQMVKEAIKIETENSQSTRPVKIAGSVGSYGAFLHDGSEYRGEYIESTSSKQLQDFHRPRIEALVQGGVDILAIETIPAKEEAFVLAELIKEFPSVKAWISFSCKDEEHTCHGDKFGAIAKEVYAMNPNQLLAVGVNCLNPAFVENLLNSVSKQVPLICYPNSGETFDPVKRIWQYKDSVPPVDSYVQRWIDAGASYIGGCCRTTSEDMTCFRRIIDAHL